MDTIQSNILALIVVVGVVSCVFLIAFFSYQGAQKDNASDCINNGGAWVVSDKDDGDGTDTQYECQR